ncbi:hypothetical protein EMIHUDRAFT_460749 [Emiliania huxleyi CCMP1516]|nr:hypothetical protein EMIHUDRAFT_460749 [Emiliania huxleyi CCMP1516]EOD25898.1 hypothetical protein EMIHUDRAFT_460749 [Emiliania huxleyi CCMP1516]|eukprot:XP_005778327.1 hypothetical protein EMIHUDRAFT_460749 [Emiliania huxleyi CCMP1516]
MLRAGVGSGGSLRAVPVLHSFDAGSAALVCAAPACGGGPLGGCGTSPFLELPPSYSQLYNMYIHRRCSVCGTCPKQPAVCLLCGAIVCTGGQCCRSGGDDEVVQHAASCGHGACAFVVVRTTTTLLVIGRLLAARRQHCWWGSLYLDVHGEEDRNLSRGRPLLLAPGRLRELQQVWRSNGLRELLYNNQPPFPRLPLMLMPARD